MMFLDMSIIETGITTTILGFGTVFFILILICVVLYIFGAIMKKIEKPVEVKATPTKPAPVKEAEEIAEEVSIDDKELIAVITAAIAASMGGNVSPDKLVVRSLRRVKSSGWKNGLLLEQQRQL